MRLLVFLLVVLAVIGYFVLGPGSKMSQGESQTANQNDMRSKQGKSTLSDTKVKKDNSVGGGLPGNAAALPATKSAPPAQNAQKKKLSPGG